MPNLDLFESLFRAAERQPFDYKPPPLNSITVVTDLPVTEADAFGQRVRAFLAGVLGDQHVRWRNVAGSEFQTADGLLHLVEDDRPDVLCTYRNLHSNAWRWPFSLGTHLDLLTQHTAIPVLVLPHPSAQKTADSDFQNADAVMAVTDHLAGDHRLVNCAVRFTEPGGRLWLTHIEDEQTFTRYMHAISRVPEIDTEVAGQAIREQLLKEPRDYIAGCREELTRTNVPVTVHQDVRFGRHISEYRKLIETNEVDLLVMHTRDDQQLAMRGIAYELAVELRNTPILMI